MLPEPAELNAAAPASVRPPSLVLCAVSVLVSVPWPERHSLRSGPKRKELFHLHAASMALMLKFTFCTGHYFLFLI